MGAVESVSRLQHKNKKSKNPQKLGERELKSRQNIPPYERSNLGLRQLRLVRYPANLVEAQLLTLDG